MTEDRIDKIKGEIKLDLINHYDCTKNFNNNINEINEYFDNLNLKSENFALLDKEKIKENAITSYCTLLTNENLQSDLSHYFIGFFIISDWYIDNNQYNFLR